MVEIWVDVGICHSTGDKIYPVHSIVDVWADHSVFPEVVLRELGIYPTYSVPVKLPDGAHADWGYGVAWLSMGDRQWPCPVVFSPDDEYRLGASALQIFNMDPDYNTGKLVPAETILLGKPENPYAGEFAQLTAVAPLEGYRIWLHYDDGVEGEVDLSHLASTPAFRRWQEPRFFETVGIGSGGTVEWDDDVALCGDALYLELTGQAG